MLAEHLAQIGIAFWRRGVAFDMIAANGNRKFRAKAQALAVFVFGQKDAAAQVFARHVKELIGRLYNRNINEFRIPARNQRGEFTGKSWGSGGDHPNSDGLRRVGAIFRLRFKNFAHLGDQIAFLGRDLCRTAFTPGDIVLDLR